MHLDWLLHRWLVPILVDSQDKTHDWLEYLAALGPLITALIAVGVGVHQNYLLRQQNQQQNDIHKAELKHQTWIQEEQLKLALYEKRRAMYTAIKEYVLSLVNTVDDAPPGEDFARTMEMWRNTGEAVFLCGEDVQDLIQTLSERTRVYRTRRQTARNFPSAENDLAAMEAQHWFSEVGIQEVKRIFDGYLKLHTHRPQS